MDLEHCFNLLDSGEDRMIDTVLQWANINSHTFNPEGLTALSLRLTDAFSVLDAEQEIITLTPIIDINDQGQSESFALGPMLRFRKRPTAPIQILLVGHMDTVYGIDHPFQKAVRKNETHLHGPGVTDMKGGLCVMLEALKAFETLEQSQTVGWEILINPDEEIGSLGSAPVLIESAKRHHLGLLFEPAMDEAGTLASTRKGRGQWMVIVRGHAAHAGRNFDEGRNAIVILAKIVSKIDAYNHQQPGVTLNVGRIRGGGSINVVPDLAICRIDVRIQTTADEVFVHQIFQSIAGEFNHEAGCQIEFRGRFSRKPKILTGKTEALYQVVVDAAKNIGQDLKLCPSGGVCDGNTLFEAGLPNVDTLGVCGGNIHSSEEYLLVKSLTARAKLTLAVLASIGSHWQN
jgi:glutamate carboxypeptidase